MLKEIKSKWRKSRNSKPWTRGGVLSLGAPRGDPVLRLQSTPSPEAQGLALRPSFHWWDVRLLSPRRSGHLLDVLTLPGFGEESSRTFLLLCHPAEQVPSTEGDGPCYFAARCWLRHPRAQDRPPAVYWGPAGPPSPVRGPAPVTSACSQNPSSPVNKAHDPPAAATSHLPTLSPVPVLTASTEAPTVAGRGGRVVKYSLHLGHSHQFPLVPSHIGRELVGHRPRGWQTTPCPGICDQVASGKTPVLTRPQFPHLQNADVGPARL